MTRPCAWSDACSRFASDAASIGPITLENKWKKYDIDLAGKDLKKIIGGFCWAASRDDNPNGFVLYLDEIRFE